MNILVTGGAGFIGSHIADLLIKNSHNVAIIDNLSNGNINNVNSKARFFQADILDSMDKIFKSEKFDALVHNAALIDAVESKSKPKLYREVNVKGTINLLEYCRKFSIKKFVFASSCAVYGNPEYLPCDEKHPKNPVNPYGESKLEAESAIIDYSEKYAIDYTILRYSNIYGPRQNPLKGGVISKFISSAMAGKNPVVLGDGRQTRDFLFVEDAALANLLALTASNRIFNIGCGKPASINGVCEEIKNEVNKKINATHSEPLKEIRDMHLDISLAEKHLQWQPKTWLADGIKKTYQSLIL